MCEWFRSGRVILTIAVALTTVGGDALFSQGPQSSRARRTEVLDGHEVVQGEVIVRYASQTGTTERERAEFHAYSDAAETIGRVGTRRLRSRTLSTRQMLATLRANPDVAYAEPNYIVRALATPNDPSFGSLWGLLNTGQVVEGQTGTPGADIGAVAAWDRTTGSRANVVAILDSGIAYNHPDLAANVFSAPRQFAVTMGAMTLTCAAGTHGFDATADTCAPFDENGHGTHVAGIIGAVGNNNLGVTGVNWTANIMALKVLEADGTGTTADIVKAINWAIKAKAALGADANIRILNASWGGPVFSQALNDEIGAANTAGMLFVAAAGSAGTNNDTAPHYPASSTHSNVISVAGSNNGGQLDASSNYGATSVDLAAPGASTLSTLADNGYGELGGTSMSAAFVSGAAALALSVCPSDTATLKSRLLAGVDLDPSFNGRTVSGGRLNIATVLDRCYPTITIGDVSVTEGNSGTSTATFTVSLSSANTSQTVTVNYATANGTATAGSDYVAASGTLTFTPSTATQTISVPINGDTTIEPTETFVVNLSGATNAMIGDAQGTGTITTDDVVASPVISPASTTVAPGGAIQFTVSGGPANRGDWVSLSPTSSGDTGWLSWTYLNGLQTPPATGVSGATLQFTAPTTPGTYNIRFFANESYTRLATSPTVTVVSGSALRIGDVSVTEGNSGTSTATFTVTLSPVNASQTVTVNYATANGTATAGSDYVAASGTLTFTPSTATQTMTVTINGDSTIEPVETFVVNLSSATNAVISDAQATGTITNDDGPGTPAISLASTTVAPGGVIQFTVSGGPANRGDWVSLSPTSSSDVGWLSWTYLNGQQTPPATGVSSVTLQFTAPTTPGTYNIRFFANESYTKLATSQTITVALTAPVISVASTTVAPGGVIQFTVSSGPANRGDWVSLSPTSSGDVGWLSWTYLNGLKTPPATGVSGATLQFAAPTTPGTYNIRFFANESYTKLATSQTITVTSTAPVISVASTTVAPGGVIQFSVSGGPGNRGDWVSFSATSSGDVGWLSWTYLNGAKTPPATGVSDATLQFTAPSTPGTYNVRFFLNDSYTKLATSATITISP